MNGFAGKFSLAVSGQGTGGRRPASFVFCNRCPLPERRWLLFCVSELEGASRLRILISLWNVAPDSSWIQSLARLASVQYSPMLLRIFKLILVSATTSSICTSEATVGSLHKQCSIMSVLKKIE